MCGSALVTYRPPSDTSTSDTRSYTWRNGMLSSQQGRIDYMLLSPSWIKMIGSCYPKNHPWSLTDHSSVKASFCLERSTEEPGIFKAIPNIYLRKDYNAKMRHPFSDTLTQNSGLSEEEKSEELKISLSIII